MNDIRPLLEKLAGPLPRRCWGDKQDVACCSRPATHATGLCDVHHLRITGYTD